MQRPTSGSASPRKGIIRLCTHEQSAGDNAASPFLAPSPSTQAAGPSRDRQGADERRPRQGSHRHHQHSHQNQAAGGGSRGEHADGTRRDHSASRNHSTPSRFTAAEGGEGSKPHRTFDDEQRSETSDGRNTASSRRHRFGDDSRRSHHTHHRGGPAASATTAGGGASKLFDPRKDDPVRFATLRKGLGITTSFDSNGAGSASFNSPSDGRSMASSATQSVTTMSTASSDGRERSRRRRGGGGPNSRTTIESSDAGSSKRKGQTDTNGGEGSVSENNSYVIELKRRYRDVAVLERKLQAEHKAATEDQRKYQQSQSDNVQMLASSTSTTHVSFSLKQFVGEGHGVKHDGSLDHAYWLDLIAQHRTLAEAHLAFMEAALLPGLPASLHSLPQTYNIPTRLWHTGFHSLLERVRALMPNWQVLISMRDHGVTTEVRHQIAETLDIMTDFIYFAYAYYSNILESETFKEFRSSWIENLGDIARYRMAVAKISYFVGVHDGVRHGAQRRDSGSHAHPLPAAAAREKEEAKDEQAVLDNAVASKEDDEEEVEKVSARMGHQPAASIGAAASQSWDLEEKEVWRNTAREWYARGLAEVPGTGRLHHHLGILSRDDDLRCLYHLCKSLTTSHPYSSARESMLPLFERSAQSKRLSDAASLVDLFVYMHGVLFTRVQMDDFDKALQRFKTQLKLLLEFDAPSEAASPHLSRSAWMMMATINIASMLRYGAGNGRSDDADHSPPKDQKQAGSRSATRKEDETDDAESDAADDDDEGNEHDVAGTKGDGREKPEDGEAKSDLQYVYDNGRPFKLTFAILEILVDLFLMDIRKRSSFSPYITIILTFLSQECKQDGYLQKMEKFVPWQQLVALGNVVPPNIEPIDPRHDISLKIRSDAIPLPEDWCLRGMAWVGRRVYERGFWKPQKIERLGLRNAALLFESEMDMLDRGGANCDDEGGQKNRDGEEALEDDDDDDDDDDDEENEGGRSGAGHYLHGHSRLLQSTPRLTLPALRWKRVVHALTILIKHVPGLDFDIEGGQVHARHGRLVIAPPLENKLVQWQAEATREEVEQAIGHMKLADLEGRTEPIKTDDNVPDNKGVGGDEEENDYDEEDDDVNVVPELASATSGDSVEVQQLVRRREELRKQLDDAKGAHRSSRATHTSSGQRETGNKKANSSVRKPASEKAKGSKQQQPSLRMVPGYTSLVVDTNVMLTPTDILQELTESGQWLIIVPLPVVTELDGLKRRTDEVGERARKALDKMEERIKTKHFRVQTSRGNYLSDLRFRTEDIHFSASGAVIQRTNVGGGSFWPATYGRDGEVTAKVVERKNADPQPENNEDVVAARSVDDVILRCVAWQAGSHWRNRLLLLSPNDEELARREAEVAATVSAKDQSPLPPVARSVLITLDRNLRIKARFRNLHAIGPSDLINLLLQSSANGNVASTPSVSKPPLAEVESA